MNEEKTWDEATINRVAEDVTKLFDGVTTVADTRGISPEELESIYSVGFANYSAGKYAEAEKVFRFLTLISHTNSKFWTAYAGAQQAQRKFQEAVESYGMAALWDLHNPRPHLYSAQCNLALGNVDLAESGCLTLLEYCPAGTATNDEYRAQAEALLAKIAAARS